MMLKRFGLAALALVMALAARAAEEGRPLIDLDAAGLAPGAVKAWANGGSAGGEFVAEGTTPVVSEVGGRRAVTLGAGKSLASSFKAPAELSGARPFTVAAWVMLPEPAKRGVVASWASRPNGTAEFSYAPGPDGAFFGWDKSVKYERFPAPGKWHYLAWSYTGEDFSVYVDGLLDSRRPMKLATKPGGRVMIGSGWDSVGSKSSYPFTGSVARVQVWGRALSQREIRKATGWQEAFAPTPTDGATVAAEETVLKWQAGSESATAYDVRVAESETAAADDKTPAQRVTAAEFKPTGLTPSKTYFWRVEQLDGAGKTIAHGPIWRFTADGGPATAPTPRDRVAGVARETKELKWTPGRYAVGQTLYFGTDREAVAGGTASSRKLGKADASTPLPVDRLEYGKVYYWRVEQDNGPLPAARGEVWAFRTDDERRPNDVTFFVSSDTHYGLGPNGEINRKVIDEMNWTPGQELPKAVGGGIAQTPRGVVLCGDLLDKGFEPKIAVPAWAEFQRDYGLTGHDGRLGYPVYEGFGNHDGMTGKSISRAGVKERNPKRVGLTAISENGFHYSWNWDQVHCAQLNLFPGTDSADCIVGPPNHHPENSLAFLKKDLAEHVVDRNKIVILFHHYCYAGGMADWWTDAAKERLAEAIKGYRVILIHGHSHGAYVYDWKGWQVISDGSTARPDSGTGDFLVVRVTEKELIVAQRKLDGWGLTLRKGLPAVTAGAPTAAK